MSQFIPGMIAAGHPCTAEAGIEMLRLGGNAFDGAVAAMLASFVAEPGLTSAAGGGFLLAHTRDRNLLFDFFVQTPRSKRNAQELDFYPVPVDFGGAVQEFHIGLASMGVPGNLAGVLAVHQKLGRLPFKVVVEPAIQYATKGVVLNSFQAYLLKILNPILTASPEGRQIYAPQGTGLEAGDKLYLKDLAATLQYLAEAGIKEFYHGAIAEQLVKDCQEKGGYLTREDLSAYQVIEREPLVTQYRDETFLTNPPPSSGGVLIAFALKLLESVDFQEVGFGSVRHLQILGDVMRLTNLARSNGYDENLYIPDFGNQFLSPEHCTEYVRVLESDCNRLGSTTHISIIDGEGNAASVTTSNGEGSSYIIPETGIMVNNMLGEADLNPNGFHQWPSNRRLSSMMAPTIVLKDNRPEIVLGSGGSNRIRTAILQVISNAIDFNMDLSRAIASPRVHWENGVFHLEPGFETEEPESLSNVMPNQTQEVIKWQEKNMFFGGVNGVRMRGDGEIEAAGDPRRNGAIAQGERGGD
ncbi:gamma-glutamyltransferase [Laspinema olomoucense]|uniref:gamma-glutamyltransferase n=1 Tax=Laspinema olomoucense TaxID=3231600 RepID=UPI0021BB5E41|nr:gamma-glutamyltransferase [Laspinema sp. D3c]MCT7995828.1 gamma-glutamyltransferase [Laspinema sp. D3c]